MKRADNQGIKTIIIISILLIILTIKTAFACDGGDAPEQMTIFDTVKIFLRDLLTYLENTFAKA